MMESQRNIPGQSTGRLHGLCVLIFLLASSAEAQKSCQESTFLESLKSEVLIDVDKDRRKREWKKSSRSKEKMYRSSLWWLIPGVQYSGAGGRRTLSLLPAWATENNQKEMLPHDAIRVSLYLDKPSGCPASEGRRPSLGRTDRKSAYQHKRQDLA